MSDALLTPQQEEFAQHFAVHRRGPEAYRHAYNVGPETKDCTVASNASRLVATSNIKARIRELQAAATANTFAAVTGAQILEAFLLMGFADPSELSRVKLDNCRFCWGDGHRYQWTEDEYFRAEDHALHAKEPLPDIAGGLGFKARRPPHPDCPNCAGQGTARVELADTESLSPGGLALFASAEVDSQGNVKVKTHDRVKALENAGRIMGVFGNDRLTIAGDLGVMATAVTTAATPADALRLYQEMVSGRA